MLVGRDAKLNADLFIGRAASASGASHARVHNGSLPIGQGSGSIAPMNTTPVLALSLALATLVGCTSDTSPCPAPVGTWTITADETSGTCGDIDETGPLLGTSDGAFLGARDSSCAGEWTATSADGCTFTLARACPVGQTLEGEIHYTDANRWDGTLTARNDGSGGFTCESAYSLTLNR